MILAVTLSVVLAANFSWWLQASLRLRLNPQMLSVISFDLGSCRKLSTTKHCALKPVAISVSYYDKNVTSWNSESNGCRLDVQIFAYSLFFDPVCVQCEHWLNNGCWGLFLPHSVRLADSVQASSAAEHAWQLYGLLCTPDIKKGPLAKSETILNGAILLFSEKVVWLIYFGV